jgi:anti-sigma regulatory factor (Ser/Thr protein kinase)
VINVPGRADAVADARHAVTVFLARLGVPSVVVDDLELVTSELVTNAVVHQKGERTDVVHVTVAVADAILLTVSNVGPVSAIPPVDRWRPAPPFAEAGRGLGIVRRLCDAVDIVQDGERAVVTCRRRLPDVGAPR